MVVYYFIFELDYFLQVVKKTGRYFRKNGEQCRKFRILRDSMGGVIKSNQR